MDFSLLLLSLFVGLLSVCECRLEEQKRFLLRRACERNPRLEICQPKAEEPIILEKVIPPPVPKAALDRMRREEEGVGTDDGKKRERTREITSGGDRESRRHIHNKDGRSKDEVPPSAPLTQSELMTLQWRCSKVAAMAQQKCAKGKMVKEDVGKCRAYFKDCAQFFSKADPLAGIADAFNSGVDLNLGTWGVKGIPYYPINEEGAIGSGHLLNIPFGSSGGGFGQNIGVRDYWSQWQEAGANWHEGTYGYKNGWSVPLVESLGIEGGQRNTAHVPLDPKHIGAIDVDNGYGVGGYYDHNDHVGVNYKRGDVQHTFSVGSPFVPAGFMTGQAVAFPGLDVWEHALGR